MAGRGMGAATQGGGAVSSGSRNKMQSTPSKSTGIPMLAKGGAVNQHKRMAMGEKVMAKGGEVGEKLTRPTRLPAELRNAHLGLKTPRPTDAINPDALSGTTPPPEGRAAPKRKLTAKEMEERLGKAKGGMAGKMMSHGGAAKKMNHGGAAKKMNYGGMAKKRTMRKGGCA